MSKRQPKFRFKYIACYRIGTPEHCAKENITNLMKAKEPHYSVVGSYVIDHRSQLLYRIGYDEFGMQDYMMVLKVLAHS